MFLHAGFICKLSVAIDASMHNGTGMCEEMSLQGMIHCKRFPTDLAPKKTNGIAYQFTIITPLSQNMLKYWIVLSHISHN